MASVEVNLGDRSYSIIIEAGSLRTLGMRLKKMMLGVPIMLAVDSKIAGMHGQTALLSLCDSGVNAALHELNADEHDKSLDAVARLYQAMNRARLERGSTLVVLGGGIVGDLAGFAAATYLRGIALVQVPSTLLAMVDASIGGKTAVNLHTAGNTLRKNIIGAFWQPRLVLIDPTLLRTLDARDFRCGIAECIKHGMIADRSLLEFIGEHASEIQRLDDPALEQLIERSARIKASIVQDDERESGRRALLNLGHTFAHAIESMASNELRHGEAVAIGLVAAMHCARRRGSMSASQQDSIIELLRRFELPIRLPKPLDSTRLLHAMHGDKKVAQGNLRLVIPSGLGAAALVEDVDHAMILSAWEAVGARMPP